MTRPEVEYTLLESGAVIARKNWWRHSKLPYQSIGLGRKYVTFNYPLRSGKKILYSDLTQEKWTELTGLKFYGEEK